MRAKRKKLRQLRFKFGRPSKPKPPKAIPQGDLPQVKLAVKELPSLSFEQARQLYHAHGLRGLEVYPFLRGLRYGEKNAALALSSFRAWKKTAQAMKKSSSDVLLRWLKSQGTDRVHGWLIDFKLSGKNPTKKDMLTLFTELENDMAEEMSSEAERFWRASLKKK